MRLSWAALVVLVGRLASAQEVDRDLQAKALFMHGRAAYTAGNYQGAYDDFRESFRLSHEPALLYNVASALQGLKRPHEAAEALRSYLRLRPEDPDKPQIDDRIAALEEEQRLLDAERKSHEPPPPVAPPPTPPPVVTAPPVVASPPPNLALTAAPPPPTTKKSHATAIAVGVTLGVVAVAGVVVGVVLGLHDWSAPLTPSPVGPIKGTP
jgi:tetratricopeptide (TPR) repeat protein